MTPAQAETAWASLKHGGSLLSPSRLALLDPASLESLGSPLLLRLRRAVNVFLEAPDTETLSALLDTVLEDVLGLERHFWLKGNAVPASWTHRAITGEAVRPRRIWQGPHGAHFVVFILEQPRIGIGHGRREAARVVEWLRRSGEKVALATNGRQWRLVHAGSDYDAWCEADLDLWFAGDAESSQLQALRLLACARALTPTAVGQVSPVVAAIAATRKGEAELSAALGERVREAVEHLIYASAPALDSLAGKVSYREIYIAACRLVLRCVVILFAESRGLLPRDQPIYNDSYGLYGLRDELTRAAGGRHRTQLSKSLSAWRRMVALFRLIHYGSAHEQLLIPRYGSELFRPGDSSEDAAPVLRSLAALESSDNEVTDWDVSRILQFITRTEMSVRQGSISMRVEAPVDFSDLSSEYLGILYEGLLDYQLKRADDPVVFLNLGDQPALPFLELEQMPPDRLKSLLEKFQIKQKAAVEEGDADGEEEDEEGAESEETEEEQPLASAEAVAIPAAAVVEEDDQHRLQRERVQQWAEKAIREARLITPRRGKSRETQERYSKEVQSEAERLIARVVMPREWYLVRFGNTRKGSGTFYTRPHLAGPIVQRTLEPLCYDENAAPRLPEQILALKVCDPAMGSGSFLVLALRYFTEALRESLYTHKRLGTRADGGFARLADGEAGNGLREDPLPVPPSHEQFDERSPLSSEAPCSRKMLVWS